MTVSLPLLPVSVSTPVTVPSREVDRRAAAGQDDLVAGAAAAVGAALDRLAGDELAAGQVDRVVAAPPSIVSAPVPPVIVSAWALPVMVKAFGLAAQRDRHAGRGAGGRDRLDALDRVCWSRPAC